VLRTIDDAKWRRSAWHALGRPSIGADGASAVLQSSVLEDGLSLSLSLTWDGGGVATYVFPWVLQQASCRVEWLHGSLHTPESPGSPRLLTSLNSHLGGYI
jgi:hypothetical protein